MPDVITSPATHTPATVDLADLPTVRDPHGGMRALCRSVLSEPTDDVDRYGKPVMNHDLSDRVQCALHAAHATAHVAFAKAEGRTDAHLSAEDLKILHAFQASGTTAPGFLATVLPMVRAKADARLQAVAVNGPMVELPTVKAARTPQGHTLHIVLPKDADAETKARVKSQRHANAAALRAHHLAMAIETALMAVRAAAVVFRATEPARRARVAGPSKAQILEGMLTETRARLTAEGKPEADILATLAMIKTIAAGFGAPV